MVGSADCRNRYSCMQVTPCNRKYPHDWASCLCGHKGERATRRDLRTHNYLPIACEYAKQRLECPRGDDCPHSHNLFEYWLHPKRFRTEMCLFRSNCDRRVCFFAHSSEELRQLQDGLPPAELCWSAGAAITSKQRSMPELSRAKQQQRCKEQQQQQQQHQQQQQQHPQMLQQALQGQLHVPASVPLLQQQQQQHAYMQLPGYAVLANGQLGEAAGMDAMSSQPLLLLQQQQQPQLMTFAAANQALVGSHILPGSSAAPFAAAAAAPQFMAVGGLAGTTLMGGLAGSNMLTAAGTHAAPSWQHPQQLQQLGCTLGPAGLHNGSGLFMVPAADGSLQGWGVDGLGLGGHVAAAAAAVTAGHLAAALPLAAAGGLPPATAGQLLTQQGIALPAGVLLAVSSGSGTDACGNDITGLAAATPSSCSSAGSSSNLLGALVGGQAAAGWQVSHAPVHVTSMGLSGMQLRGSNHLHMSGDLSQVMQQFKTLQLAVTQA
uniref:C3H1-type domain-containing protein n=1 Tax=Tetradesmus obliquus TaxID=3088 RepID=A0A383VI06_TETOB|eukprot:jgi/Sobl393_1/829/SZX64570.1